MCRIATPENALRGRLAIILLSSLLLGACGNSGRQEATMESQEATRKTTPPRIMQADLAGSWYSADPRQLRAELERYIRQAGAPELTESVSAIIMPHAGYAFSGPAGAHAIKEIAGQDYQRVIVLGLTHRTRLPNQASVADATHYRTPLGDVPLDQDAIQHLKRSPLFAFHPRSHQGENSIELQVPFLQVALDDFQMIMIAVGQLDEPTARRIANTLLEVVDDKTLVVASGDFTHYGPRFDYLPFLEDIPENLKELDLGAFDKMQQKDLTGWLEYISRTGATICGHSSFATLIAMLADHQQVHLLRYTTSGELTGDWANSVSYIAAAVTGAWQPRPPSAKAGTTDEAEEATPASLNQDDKRALLQLARGTLERRIRDNKTTTPEDLSITITPAMQKVMGAFVTLHKHNELRGCIGEIIPRRPLYQAVIERALSSALEDPRFPAVQPEELADIHIEISALSPPVRIKSYQDIVLGRHGIIFQKGHAASVFLPQVPPEQGWDLPTTLAHLCMKAGLPPDAWREGARFEVFEATVFQEKDFDSP